MKIKFAISILALICGLSTPAFAVGTFIIEGIVYDRATDTQLFGTEIRLINASDSTITAKTLADGYRGGNKDKEPVRMSMFTIYDVDRSGKYILELTHADYEPAYIDIDPVRLSNRLAVMNLGKLYMKRRPIMLDEIVVKASKVMFYNKEDTVIYNADAFVLAEGSMLDALIRQMPGVELKDGGQIYINGRYVENLLLNGQDFFKGNRQTMLNNLGAYTVKNIAVYESQDEMDRIMGKGYGEKRLSMDVRLKKEYNQGLLTNMEAGYGTSNRYLGRVFGLWYSDNARLSLYGNANNLSDNRKPGQDTGLTPGSMQSGDFKTYQGGFDYWTKIPYKDVSFSGDFIATHQTVNDNQSVLTTNFLPGGDTYGYSYAESRNRFLSLTTSHWLDIQKPNWNFKLSPSFKYSRNNDFSSLSTATFSKEWNDIGKDFIDNLYNGASAEMLVSILNRNKDDNKSLGHSIDADFFANGKAKMHNDADAITYLVSGNYKRRHYDRFQKYILNFGANPTPVNYSDRYFNNTPNYQWSVKEALGYIWAIKPGLFLDSWYQYEHNHSYEMSDLYSLENIYHSASDSKSFGWLPSKAEYESTIDPNNSFKSKKTENNHSINLKLTWNSNKSYLTINLPVVYRNQHLHYIRGNANTSFSRNRLFIGDTTFDLNYLGSPHYVYIEYRRRIASPNLVDMVDFKNTLDPLNVKLGNPNLKDSESHQLSLFYKYNTNNIFQRYGLDVTVLRNALAYGYRYDLSNGVRTGMMCNVNGNYNLELLQRFLINFGSMKQFSFSNSTRAGYRHSVDLISDNSNVPKNNKVKNQSLNENLELSFKFSNSKISLNGEAGINRFNSRQANFRNFTATDFKYGVNGNFNLPAGLGISTDFTVYTRCGYSDSSLNDTNYVWNARASYTVKGQLTFMVDGFDILNNLNNVFYNVNAQARTETYTNVLPRYVVFHVQWKFHKAPKKK